LSLPEAKVQPKKIQLHPKQFDAFEFTSQFCLAVAGVRGGKTYVGAVWAGNKLNTSEGDGLITAPDFQTLRDATLATFFQVFPSYRQFYKEQKHVIEFPNGKKIYLRSLDNPLSAEGITVDWVWADEAGKYKVLAWHSLRSRVSLTKGQILLTTTPYNMGWLYEEFFKVWQEGGDPEYTVVQWASVDNPYFPKEFYDAEKKRLSRPEFERRYMGSFSKMSGLVYNMKGAHIIDPLTVNAEVTLGGIDWGWWHPAIVVIKLFKGCYYLVDEWFYPEQTTSQIVEKMIELQNQWGINRWYADSANPEKIAEANNNTGLQVIGYEKKKDSIQQGVSIINQLMMDNRFRIFRGNKNTLEEFDMYQYPEQVDGKEAKDEPMPFNNHFMDAMRYAIMGYQPAMRFRTPPTNQSYTQLEVSRMLGGDYARHNTKRRDDLT
jgi:PBSX family phage terminase large subunit